MCIFDWKTASPCYIHVGKLVVMYVRTVRAKKTVPKSRVLLRRFTATIKCIHCVHA